MALIKCSECGKEISDKASSCIHCGCPINAKVNHNNFKSDILKLFKTNNNAIIIGGVILFILLFIIIYNIVQPKPNIVGTWEDAGYIYGVSYSNKYTFKKNGTATLEAQAYGYGNGDAKTTKCRYKFRNKNTEIKIIKEGYEDKAEWVNFSMNGDTIYIDNTAYKRK